MATHQWFWGSHGCGLPEGHKGPCQCMVWECNNFDSGHDCTDARERDCQMVQVVCMEWADGKARFVDDDGARSEWQPWEGFA